MKFQIQLLLFISGLGLVSMGMMYGVNSMFDYATYTRPCQQLGDLYKLNTKTVGHDCYVEYLPGQWVDDYEFKSIVRNQFHSIIGQ